MPVLILFEARVGRNLPISHGIDNAQTLTGIKKGYSKNLRHLQRTQRVALGLLHECLENEELGYTVYHCPSAEQKGDIFTKALDGTKFGPAVEMLGLTCSVGALATKAAPRKRKKRSSSQ